MDCFQPLPNTQVTPLHWNLLDFCQVLFERSCEAVNAFAGVLHSFYERRGFRVVAPDVRRSLKADVPSANYVFRGHHAAIHFAALLHRQSNGMTAYV